MNHQQPLGRVTVIVPAAGQGVRMGAIKQYLTLNGKPLLEHTLARLLAMGPRELVLVVSASDETHRDIPGVERCRVVIGGVTRADSVRNALAALDLDDEGWVMVHDAARPCVLAHDVLRLYEIVCEDEVGGILARPVVETVKRAEHERVVATVDRQNLWLAQTPQMFRYGLLKKAMAEVLAAGLDVTDEAAAVERQGFQPRLVACDAGNIKVTHPGDVPLAEYYLASQEAI